MDPILDLQISLMRGHSGVKGNSYGYNLVTQPTTVKINLKKSKTERYYAYDKFQVQLCKSSDWSPVGPWFLNPYLADKPERVKAGCLARINFQREVYNLVFKHVYDRCLETCDEKTLQVEIGRKHQPVSTVVLATEPFNPENIWVYVHFPESLRNKLNEWLNCSFRITLSEDPITVHSYFGETTETPCWGENKVWGGIATKFDWDSRWLVERAFANGPAITDTDFTFPFHVELNYSGFHPDVFMPDYFTSGKPRPWTGELVEVLSSSGDSSYCYLAALKSCSKVFEAQVRWNTAKEIPLTLELPTEVFQPLVEFINYSHVSAATKSFNLAVELLIAANKYDVKELQEKLLDMLYVLPFSTFDDTEALVQLYLLLDVTRISDCVLQRVEGIVKLKANEILSSPIFQDLDPTQKTNISSLISSYDVVLDIITLWSDNKHNTIIAKNYERLETMMAENPRIQAIHKRKPWQICCDYLNYCNFTPDNAAPPGEVPDRLWKIQKTYFPPDQSFCYSSILVAETPYN